MRSVKLPLIRVRLFHGEECISTVALVDTGATSTFLPKELADILGLPIIAESDVIAAGTRFTADVRILERLRLVKGMEDLCEFERVMVLIPRTEGAIPYMVLGRDTIFQAFEIRFREMDGRFVLRKY